jgi:hypothetical protein
VIQVIVVAECGSELSQIWTASSGIPNSDLEGSGEVSAMCSTPRTVTNPGVASLARRLYPKAGPVIVRAVDRTRLHTEEFGHEDSYPTAGLPVEVCILHQMNQPQPQSLLGLGVVTSPLVTNTRRVTVEAGPRPIPQSTSILISANARRVVRSVPV